MAIASMLPPVLLACAVLTCIAAHGAPWYDGIESILVLSAGVNGSGVPDAQQKLDNLWQEMEQDAHGNSSAFQKGQFGKKRRAVLLRSGDYGSLKIPVNWYTAVMGVGLGPQDVLVNGFSSIDAYPGSVKGSLENFWKSVEGLTTTENSTLWAVSQAAPLRRVVIRGDLWLSETGEGGGAHYTSGGFMADVDLHGSLNWGTQQQFFFRNSRLASVNYTESGQSMVFVGVEGSPEYDISKPKPLVSRVVETPVIAEKPYLTEELGTWSVAVPSINRGTSGASSVHGAGLSLIPMAHIFVAREGDSAETIQAGIKGKRALLLTPAIYGLNWPIYIESPGFVVLGIGMPTLVSLRGFSALVISPNADRVRVAHVLLEAGKPYYGTALSDTDSTDPLLDWQGHDGVGSDIFARVGAFSYETDFHKTCEVTRADIMMRTQGYGMVLDNVWLWHADHDDCTSLEDPDHPLSDQCYSRHGLVVNGDQSVAYGLAVEHTKADLVQWNGENGLLFFFQSELPYRSNLNFGVQGFVGFRVGYNVRNHTNYGVGVYQVFNTFKMQASIRLPETANVTNMFSWCIAGNRSGLGSLVCTTPGDEECMLGDCDEASCQMRNSSVMRAGVARASRATAGAPTVVWI